MWGKLNNIDNHADSGTAIEYLQGKTIANTVDLHSKTTKEEVTKTISEKPGNYRFRVKFSSLKHQTVQSMLSMCRRSCRVRPLFFPRNFVITFWFRIIIKTNHSQKLFNCMGVLMITSLMILDSKFQFVLKMEACLQTRGKCVNLWLTYCLFFFFWFIDL